MSNHISYRSIQSPYYWWEANDTHIINSKTIDNEPLHGHPFSWTSRSHRQSTNTLGPYNSPYDLYPNRKKWILRATFPWSRCTLTCSSPHRDTHIGIFAVSEALWSGFLKACSSSCMWWPTMCDASHCRSQCRSRKCCRRHRWLRSIEKIKTSNITFRRKEEGHFSFFLLWFML